MVVVSVISSLVSLVAAVLAIAFWDIGWLSAFVIYAGLGIILILAAVLTRFATDVLRSATDHADAPPPRAMRSRSGAPAKRSNSTTI
ncbi:MAG: hypothetical protein HKP40_01660 [Litoreibacter sp.]|nr:hypothetical protein [Litoreibacter sp.]